MTISRKVARRGPYSSFERYCLHSAYNDIADHVLDMKSSKGSFLPLLGTAVDTSSMLRLFLPSRYLSYLILRGPLMSG